MFHVVDLRLLLLDVDVSHARADTVGIAAFFITILHVVDGRHVHLLN